MQARTFEFRCPECREVIEVNDGVREATMEYGCPVCAAVVTRAAFSVG